MEFTPGILGARIKRARKRLGFSQSQLASATGIKSPQIISQIEKGDRELRAWELAKFADSLKISIEDLISSRPPEQPPEVLWRDTPENEQLDNAEFIRHCQDYFELEQLCDETQHESLPVEEFDPYTADYSDVESLAERASRTFTLGSRPALVLPKILEDRYGVKIWYKDLGDKGSAAASKGPFGSAILMNLTQAPWRRNYNFGHEVFHLLTWESVPPLELKLDQALWEKVEKFANAFSSHLLLPADIVLAEFDKRVQEAQIEYIDLIGIARELDVSTEALLYRLRNLHRLSSNAVDHLLEDPKFREMDKQTMPPNWWTPPEIPERYVRLAFKAFQKDKLSKARLTQYLKTSLLNLSDTLSEFGFNDTQDFETAVPTT